MKGRDTGVGDVEGEGKPSRIDDTKTSRTADERASIRCDTRDRETNARTSDGYNFAIRASGGIVHAPLKTTKQCVEARFCPVTSRPFRSRPQPEKESGDAHTGIRVPMRLAQGVYIREIPNEAPPMRPLSIFDRLFNFRLPPQPKPDRLKIRPGCSPSSSRATLPPHARRQASFLRCPLSDHSLAD